MLKARNVIKPQRKNTMLLSSVVVVNFGSERLGFPSSSCSILNSGSGSYTFRLSSFTNERESAGKPTLAYHTNLARNQRGSRANG